MATRKRQVRQQRRPAPEVDEIDLPTIQVRYPAELDDVFDQQGRWRLIEDSIEVDLKARLVDGRYRITRVDVVGGLLPEQFAALPWVRMVDDALRAELYHQVVDQVSPDVELDTVLRTAGTLARRHRRRNRVDDNLLAETAEIVQAGGDIDAVAERFMVSTRSAQRYVTSARTKGLLP